MNMSMFHVVDAPAAASMFRALSDPVRIQIVALLSHAELCVCHLQEFVQLPQPTVSRHLAVLRKEGLVEARKKGRWVHYRLAKQSFAVRRAPFRALIKTYAGRADLKREAERLQKAVGPGASAS
jgi:ArsR family transcriptional regulator